MRSQDFPILQTPRKHRQGRAGLMQKRALSPFPIFRNFA
jgi:hypothetical protein